MKRALYALILSALCHVGVHADISAGKAYKIQNVQAQNYLTSNGISSNPTAAAESTDPLAQCWYLVDAGDGNYRFRDMSTGYYLQSSTSRSGNWSLTSDASAELSAFVISPYDDGTYYTIYASSQSESTMAMHRDNGNGIVCWGDASGNSNSRWTFTLTEYTDEEITQNFEKLEAMQAASDDVSTIQAALQDLFSDNACTSLKATGDFAESDSYKALPAVLQNMVTKVSTDSWTESFTASDETISWDSDYAKKYRVQLYEPYSEPEASAAALRINAHTNLNNPTGIFADKFDVLYVMVEGTLKDGASLYLASYTGHGRPGGYSGGVQLSEGLNVIPVYADGTNFVINYVVHTFDTSNGTGSNAKTNKLSDYSPLKIHIEGGKINGYYNKVGDELYTPDDNADWEYIEERATQTDVTVLGRYMTLQFPLNDDDTEGNKGLAYYLNDTANIEDVIDAWDNVMLWERLLMGLCDESTVNAEAITSPYSNQPIWTYSGNDDKYASDYSDYYNVHGLAYGVGGSTYMYGGWDHSGYHYNTMPSIITLLPTDAGVQWGPAHEIGHQHQGPLNMRGLTEVTNNLFSNMVLWCFGKSTSRYNGTSGSLENVLATFNDEESDFFNLNIWAQTQMYYKFFLYYHVLGHNTKFYPRLYEMLRQDPMTIQYNQDGAECLLHFYKKCCQAAEEDLTEFFRAHGFFRVMTDRFVGDYSNAVYNMTQEQIDAAIADVKDYGYEENIEVLFINDGTGSQILSHRDDTEYLAIFDGSAINAELGSYASFSNSGEPSYSCSVSGSTLTMEGSGGIGFVVYNSDGEIICFSDKKSFEVSDECARLIMSGEASVAALDSEGMPYSLEIDVNDRYALLGDLIARAKAIIDLTDNTGTKVGFYRSEYLTELAAVYEDAQKVYSAKTESAFASVYEALDRELSALDENARISIVPENAYRLTNKAYPERSMTVDADSSNAMSAIETDESSDAQKWYLEAAATDGTYYLKNKSSQTYPGNVSTGAPISATATSTDDAYAYTLQDMGNGSWAFVGATALHCSSSQSYNIVGWGSSSSASQWYITAVEVDAEAKAQRELAVLIEQTEELISEMAVSGYPVSSRRYILQVTDANEKGYLTCSNLYNPNNVTTNGDDVDYNCAQLLDSNEETYIHTDYTAATETYPHYLRVDFGDAAPESFKFSYTTRHNGANQVPKKIVVKGSNDDSDYTDLAVFTSSDSSNPLPTEASSSWTSSDFIANEYRYLRFEVQESAQGTTKPYFVMAEFAIICDAPLCDVYAEDCADEYLAAIEQLESAKSASDDSATSAYVYLKEKYNALLAARNAADSSALTACKVKLQELIYTVTTLIETCAEVTYTAAVPDYDVPLQVSDESADFYIWTNAQSTQEGPITNLIDGDTSTYFHTDYSGNDSSDGLDHHLTVNLGQENAVSQFQFSYTNRSDADANYPAEIVVYGSNDGSDFTELTTLTDLPATQAASYESSVIEAAQSYAYLRFMVTKNSNNNAKGGHQFFHMAEFSIHAFGSEAQSSVVLTENSGNASEQLVLAAYIETLEAASVVDYGTTEAQVQTAYDELNSVYQELKAAQEFDTSALAAILDEMDSMLEACDASWLNPVDTENYASDIETTRQMLEDKAIDSESYDSVLEEWTDKKANLTDEMAYGPLPVKLSASHDAPAYHVFVINRGESTVLKKGGITTDSRWPQDHKIRVTDRAVPADEQLWYFTKGDAAPAVRIFNKAVAADSLMSVISGDITEGAGKVGFYNADGSDGELVCDQWLISDENSAEGFYNLTDVSGSNYFSNYGGTSNNMGFYNSNTNTDGGSNFRFEPKSDAWMTLYDFFRNEAKVALSAPDYIFPSELVHATTAGCYTQSLATAYENAYSSAHTQILASSASDEELSSAYSAVKAANDALVENDGESVGIVEITMDSLDGAVIYDLQGRRITRPSRLGIYIIDGVKVILK